MTFKEVMEEYFKSWGLSVRLSTSISHKKSFAYQCGDLLDLDIIDISKETIENHLAEMLSRLSQSTVAHWNARCKNILEYAYKNKYIDSDFYKDIVYIKVKNSIEEVKVYFDVILKDKEYLIREVESDNIFDFKKKAIIYMRDSIPAFDKVPMRFLPETELKSLIREIIQLDIAELEHTDFKTFVEKISYGRLVKELKNKMENDENEKK